MDKVDFVWYFAFLSSQKNRQAEGPAPTTFRKIYAIVSLLVKKIQDYQTIALNSLAIRLRSEDLHQLILGNGYPNYRFIIHLNNVRLNNRFTKY